MDDYVGSLDDRQLLERIQGRDSDALIALYRRYGGKVLALALRILSPDRAGAEEVVQEVFYRLWERSHLYDHEKGALLAWLLTITRNIALDSRRRESRRATFFVPISMTEERNASAAANDNPERSETIRQALQTLPPAQRTVVEMLYFEGLTNAELSVRLGEPLGTVKTRARLAMERLRTFLTGAGKGAKS